MMIVRTLRRVDARARVMAVLPPTTEVKDDDAPRHQFGSVRSSRNTILCGT
jgi:hypothetical protein